MKITFARTDHLRPGLSWLACVSEPELALDTELELEPELESGPQGSDELDSNVAKEECLQNVLSVTPQGVLTTPRQTPSPIPQCMP